MTNQEAIKIASDFYMSEEIYCLLSVDVANMTTGTSVPYIARRKEDGKHLLMFFSSFENAKFYIDFAEYPKPAGLYMVSKIQRSKENDGLDALLNCALQTGVDDLLVNPMAADSFGCNIAWFMSANMIEKKQVAAYTTEEELEAGKKQNNGQLPMHFDMLPIYQFASPYAISDERANAILSKVFQGGASVEEFRSMLHMSQSLNENCFVAEVIANRMIPLARKNRREADMKYFMNVASLLQYVVWDRLKEEKTLYTLVEPDTEELFVNRDAMYVLFSDFYKNNTDKKLKKISGRQEIVNLVAKNQLDKIIVSNGFDKMIIIQKPVMAN
ncbi:MAG: hypothetical protein MJ114_01310 [Acetatifactor sp.]|nr:hypothetical protein [Acetatifactor sp.]